MATWQQVRNYIFSKYQVSNDNGNFLTLVFDMGNGRSQMVHVGQIEAGEMSSVIFSSPFADKARVSADRALNATEVVPAAIKSIGDYYAVSHTQLLGTIDEPEIDWPIILVTTHADQLEQHLGIGDNF